MDEFYDLTEDYTSITLAMEDGSEMEFDVLQILTAGDKYYVVLKPEWSDEISLYRYIPHGEDEFEILNIESQEEWDIANEKCQEWLAWREKKTPDME